MADSARPRFTVPWRIRDPILVLVWTYACIIALSTLAVIGAWWFYGRLAPPDSGWLHRLLLDSPAVDLWAILQGLITLWLLRVRIFNRYKVNPADWLPTRRIRSDVREAVRLYFMALVLSAVVIFGIATLAQTLMAWIFRVDPAQMLEHYLQGLEKEAVMVLGPEIGWLRVALVTVVIPPIEELLFRGCLYPALRKRFNPWPAIFLSSAAFALSHHYSFGLPNILVIGVLGAYAYERTRSLWTPLIFHMLWNLGAAASVKPVLWGVLGVILAGLWLWSWRVDPEMRARPRIEGRRLGWRVYAVLYVALSALDVLAEPGHLWMALGEVPLWFGLFAYAWRRPTAKPLFWRVYGLLLLAFVAASWWASLIPLESQTGWQVWLAGGESQQFETLWHMAGALVGSVLIMGPAFIIVSRLARPRPAVL